MPLFQSTELQTAAPYAVPTSDAVRQQALARGWQRSRRVAQRRLAWRWLAWALTRFGVPVLLVLTLGLSLAELVGSAAYYFLPSSANLAAAPQTAKPPSVPGVSAAPSAKTPPESDPAAVPAATAKPAPSPSAAMAMALPLRLSRDLAAASAAPAASAPPVSANPIADPILHPTPLLQRKEPL